MQSRSIDQDFFTHTNEIYLKTHKLLADRLIQSVGLADLSAGTENRPNRYGRAHGDFDGHGLLLIEPKLSTPCINNQRSTVHRVLLAETLRGDTTTNLSDVTLPRFDVVRSPRLGYRAYSKNYDYKLGYPASPTKSGHGHGRRAARRLGRNKNAHFPAGAGHMRCAGRACGVPAPRDIPADHDAAAQRDLPPPSGHMDG